MSTKTYTKLPKGLPPLPPVPKGYDRIELKGWGWNSRKKVPYNCVQMGDRHWFGEESFLRPDIPAGNKSFFYILAVKDTPKKKPAPKKVLYHNPEKVPQSKVPAGWRFLRKGEKIADGTTHGLWFYSHFDLTCLWSEDNDREYFSRWSIIIPDKTPALKNTATGIEALVCKDIADRQAVGMKKYGVSVQDNPLSELEWLQHLYEEILDSATYLRRLIELKKGKK